MYVDFLFKNWWLTMYKKKRAIELADTMVGDPCIPVDGNFFIWTSTNMMFIFCRYTI
jgi:hypothetical protein